MKTMTLEELGKAALKKQETYKKSDNGFICPICNSEILCVTVSFPIWDGPFPMSGSGKCEKQVFPYCPKCEPRPEIQGEPITVKP